jgi:nicotinamide mononucleotide transporter
MGRRKSRTGPPTIPGSGLQEILADALFDISKKPAAIMVAAGFFPLVTCRGHHPVSVSPLELIAALVGAVSVWLSVRQNIWSWPSAIVNVVLYTIVFFQAKLYADMGLQVIYAILSIYGWYEWLHGGENRTELHVTRTTPRLASTLVAIALVGSVLLGTLLRQATDAALPFMDSFLSSTSLVAQWMMTRKKLEHWLVWIAVDVLYVGMFIFKGLYLTAGLYAVFLVLAITGYVDWRRSLAPMAPAAVR